MNLRLRFWAAAGLVMVLVFATGCNKVTKENFNKVQIGMTRQQVIDILGKPTGESWTDGPNGTIPSRQSGWGSGDKHIVVNFVNEKVVSTKSVNL